VNLYYERHAGLSKRDTLFLHGNLASHRWWHPALNEMKKSGAKGPGTVVTSDWRGCGRNEEWPGDRPFTLEDLAEDKLALLDALGMKKDVALVGHSLGGLIALQMMVLDPGRFSRAVLLDPVGAKGVIFDDSMYEAFRQMAQSQELTRAVILSTVMNADGLDDEFKERIAADAFKAVRGIGASVLQILKSVDLTAAAARVTVPTLILHGEKDQIIPKTDSEALSKIMPNSRLEILPANGHCWNVENPKAFAERVNEWLEA
jgi:pimeloyl-ACP methyl ester carboxylesterase